MRLLLEKTRLWATLLAWATLCIGCSVGSDLSGKQFSCTTTADCVAGAYCDPSVGACVSPDRGDGLSLPDAAQDAGAEVVRGDAGGDENDGEQD